MPLFTSSEERRLWLCACIVVATIISTLIFGRPFAELFANQDVQAVIFLLGMVIIGTMMIIHGIRTQPGKAEILIWLGFAAIFGMFFLRLGLAERSHLMEYAVLAIFVHMALIERSGENNKVLKLALLAIGITFTIGVLDECVQIFLPNRVFDINDIMFNGFSAVMAIGTRIVLQWVRKRVGRT